METLGQMSASMPIHNGHEGAVPVPFRYAGLIENAAATEEDRTASVGISTNGTRSVSSIWELLQFWFEHEDSMPPRTVSKPNWMLVLTAGSMVITVLTLLSTGVWVASQKNTNLDVVKDNITNNTAEIKAMNVQVVALQVEITKLKDKNDELVDRIAEIKSQLQSKKDK